MAVNINVPSQVRTFANLAAFPASGSLKTIYIAEDTNKTYRWDGSTYVEISASAATSLTIGTTPIASGTIGRVLFQGTGNVLQQSSSLFWDSTNNRLGIGTNTPVNNLHINASNDVAVIRLTTIGTGSTLTDGFAFGYDDTLGGLIINRENTPFGLYTNNTERLRIFANGNIGINTTTDAGFRLDVNGTARVQTSLLLGSSSISASAYPLQVVGGAGGSALFSNTTRTQALNINLTTANETRIYTDYFLTGADQKLILGTFANRANQLVLNTTGNLLINTTTDAGFKLDVNGAARVQGNFGVPTGFLISLNGVAGGNELISGGNSFFQFRGRGSAFLTAFNGGGGESTAGVQIGFSLPYNGTPPNLSSAILEITSTTKGFLPPRMTTTQKNAIASPAAGLVVYDNTDNKHYGYNGTTWNAFY
jgi:hypothetical protein